MEIKYALNPKITCAGVKPTKAEVYTLAAELVDTHKIATFKAAVTTALVSYDYYDYDYAYAYAYAYAYYDYYDHYDYYDYNDYDYNDHYNLSSTEKVIALLFLAAMYSE